MAVVGIDLGTTNSVVAAVRDGRVTVIHDAQKRRLHPSVVSFHPNGSTLYSYDAVARRIVDGRNTIYSAKRLIGQPFRSPEVKYAAARMSYKIEEGPNEQVAIKSRGRTYSVPEVSGLVLAYLKRCAEDFLGEAVDRAVVTVPANFNDAQRRATIDAGRIAGLDVLRVLNEPTAAALAYGAGRGMSQKIGIYDLGGGTFDVTVLQVEGDIFEVLATGGDTFLGGDDVDSALMALLAEQFLTEFKFDLRTDEVARSRLLLAAEQIKRHLSMQTEAKGELKEMAFGAGGKPLDLRFHVSRARFEKEVSPLVERTIKTCDDVLRLADLAGSQLDEVIMVGGSTRIPLVRARVAEHFGKPSRVNINPDEVVAWGAAIQAHALAFGAEDPAAKAVLLDVTPRGLGIAVAGGYAETIVERNAQVPVEQTRVFTTSADNQTQVRIQVCQGESRRFDENVAMGELTLSGFRAARRGEVKIEVSFGVDTNGIMRVRAQDPDTGVAQEATVNVRGALSENEVAAATTRTADHQSRDTDGDASAAPPPALLE